MVNIVDEAIDRARSFKNKVFGKAQSLANGNLDLINLAKLPRRTVQRVVDNVFGGTVIVDNPIVKTARSIEILPSGGAVRTSQPAKTMAPAQRVMAEPESRAERVIRIQSV